MVEPREKIRPMLSIVSIAETFEIEIKRGKIYLLAWLGTFGNKILCLPEGQGSIFAQVELL